MVITVRRSFPWLPVALAIAWALMMSLTVRDLAWFAGFSSAVTHCAGPANVANPEPSAATIKLPTGIMSCAAVMAPVVRTIR